MMMMMQFSSPKLSCRRQTRSTREDTTPEEEDAEEGGNIFARVRSLLTASSSTSSSSANPTNTREKERKNERTKALFLLFFFFFYEFRVSPPVQMCALLWINASRTSTERERGRENALFCDCAVAKKRVNATSRRPRRSRSEIPSKAHFARVLSGDRSSII